MGNFETLKELFKKRVAEILLISLILAGISAPMLWARIGKPIVLKNTAQSVRKLPPIHLTRMFKSADRRVLAKTRHLLGILLKKKRYLEWDDLSYNYVYLAQLLKAKRLNRYRKAAILKQLFFNIRYYRYKRSPGHSFVKSHFKGSRLTFTYFRRSGWQIHPLSSLKRCKALLRKGNRREFLRTLLEILRVGAPRGKGRKFFANEHYFKWEESKGPWISSMVEGLKLSLLSKALKFDHNKRRRAVYKRAVEDSLRAFETNFRYGGVRDSSWYLQYAFHNKEKVLNGFQYSLLGLYDFFTTLKSPHRERYHGWIVRSKKLFGKGIIELNRNLYRYDLGRWSRYSLIESPATPEYHWANTNNLKRLARETKDPIARKRFLSYAARWSAN